MKFQILPVTAFQQNCTLIWCERTRQAAILDPGGESERILELADRLELQPALILLTHGHLDHVGASAGLAEHLAIPILGPHRDDAFWIDDLAVQCRMFGVPPQRGFVPDRWLVHGDRVEIGDESLEVLHCPGHTPGHVVYFHAGARLAWVGDVLFRGAIGRTDFPGGSHAQLLSSIREKLLPLGDDVRFVPGHGSMSSLGEERHSNPFIRPFAGDGLI